MHRRSQGNPNLIPSNPEIEATTRRRGREARRKKRAVVEMTGQDQRMLRDYALQQASGITSSIVSPAVEANNFNLSLALIISVERDQFGRYPSDNPNMYLCKFFAKCDTIKFNRMSTDAIQLRLFPISLKDRASNRLQN